MTHSSVPKSRLHPIADASSDVCSPYGAANTSISLPRTYRANALNWFKLGFTVLPVVPGTKQPAVKWDAWLEDLTERKVFQYWTDNPAHEIGAIIGDGMIVFDADSPGATAALIEAECWAGVLPSMIAQTNRGEHHYYLTPSDLACKTTCMVIGESKDRIDVKTGRSMIILPPSTGKFLMKLDFSEHTHVSQFNAAPLTLLKKFGALDTRVARANSVQEATDPPNERTMLLLTAGLKRLSADCDYDTWLRIGAVVFHVSGGTAEGVACFDAWSATSAKYKAREVLSKWKSFRLDHPNPCTLGTLRFMLEKQGHDWLDVCAEANGDAFEVVEMEVNE